jgi:2-amino-4-hydroxy-6-hydroxymethyldihydropteridine diphosphokinase
MILLGLGANLPNAESGLPLSTLIAALEMLESEGVAVVRRSPWYRSAPVPASSQPWFVNGVAALQTSSGPEDLLARLHHIEDRFGRIRRIRNEPRSLDLDLLDYDGRIRSEGPAPILPHPRLHERAFVLLPLSDVAPDWRHPVFGTSVTDLIAGLPEAQAVERLSP